MSWLDNVAAAFKETKQVVTRPLAGAVNALTQNTELPNVEGDGIPIFGQEYRPAVVDGPGQLIALGQMLFGNKPSSGYIADSLTRAKVGADRTNAQLGTVDARNAVEVLLEVGGAMGPGVGVNAVSKAASALPRVVQTPAKIVAEVLLPVRNTKYKTAVAVGGTLATGLNEGIDHIQDRPDYVNVNEATSTMPKPRPTPILTPESAREYDMAQRGVTQEQLDLELDIDLSLLDDGIDVQQQSKDEQFDQALMFGFGAATVAAAAFGVRNALLSNPPRTVTGNLVGTKFRDSALDFGKKVEAYAVDSKAPMYEAVDSLAAAGTQFMSPANAKAVGYALDVSSNTATQSKVIGLFKTGKSPARNGKRYQRLDFVLDSYAKELTPDEQNFVSSAMLARSALDDFQRTGVWSAFNKDAAGNPFDATLAQHMVNTAANNPKYNKYMNTFGQTGKDMLDYQVDMGLISNAERIKLLQTAPNWVPFSRALNKDAKTTSDRTYSANQQIKEARAIGTFQSVQGGAVATPVNQYPDKWANIVHAAETNKIRRDILRAAEANNRYKVRDVTGQNLDDAEDIHTVYDMGVAKQYRVSDPVLAKALHFYPRASVAALETARNITTNMITGPLGTVTKNLFAFAKAPVYDAAIGSINRPRGVNLGILAETASRLSDGAVNLGGFDPTKVLSAYAGGIRYMLDTVTSDISRNLESAMFQENSMLKQAMQATGTTNIPGWFSKQYETSTRALMDETGISSHILYGDPDATKPVAGMSKIAPRFHTEQARFAYDETVRNGRPFVEQQLAKAGLRMSQAQNNAAVNTIMNLFEAAHNGFKYGVVQANKSGMPDIDQLAAIARNISIDTSRHGNAEGIGGAAISSIPYMNVGVQSIFNVAKKFRTDPAHAMFNITVGTLPVLGFHYWSMLNDPEALDRHLAKTPEQKLRTVSMAGGYELPLDPQQMLWMAAILPTFDVMTDTYLGAPNPDIIDAFSGFIGDEFRQGAVLEQAGNNFGSAIKINNPVDFNSIPFVAAAGAGMGMDMGATRMAGEVAPVRTQNLTGFEDEKARPNSITSAYVENLIKSTMGGFGTAMLDISNTYFRAAGQEPNNKATPIKLAADAYFDGLTGSTPALRSLWVGDTATPQSSIVDDNFLVLNDKGRGVDRALAIYNKDARSAGLTGLDRKHSLPEFDDSNIKPNYIGTPAALVGQAAKDLKRSLNGLQSDAAQLSKQAESVNAGYFTTKEERRQMLRDINEKRRYNNFVQLQIIQEREALIAQMLGVPDFSFDDFDPDKATGQLQQ